MTSLPTGSNRIKLGNGAIASPNAGQKIQFGKHGFQGDAPRLQVPPPARIQAPLGQPQPRPQPPPQPQQGVATGEHVYVIEVYIQGADGQQYSVPFQASLPVRGELQGFFFYEAEK